MCGNVILGLPAAEPRSEIARCRYVPGFAESR
ncbi:hypothetical protein SACE_1395 [Saccharopolyspora erythraea NRRL 2338]|uniref:Uncharacterized protein n=1 Tax=Saccharopolyspora erythraea (strain ATCC 11635 / DSM 40517 / JCM 4748 / NBRC 13426 / NCIMB 8594 / NRRL 2338) TaxID=405948 RepID=A4F9J2_SACEN|nr:hypothetical protein SACE_1395 [Saccharopolyspora erythraea NRRL 2338]